MTTADFALDPDTAPVLDQAYLDDMRQWVGDDTLAGLLLGAPSSITTQVAAVRTAWEDGDLDQVREAAHRLKGAAGSIACRHLSALAHQVQFVSGLERRDLLDSMMAALAEALAALESYRGKLTSS